MACNTCAVVLYERMNCNQHSEHCTSSTVLYDMRVVFIMVGIVVGITRVYSSTLYTILSCTGQYSVHEWYTVLYCFWTKFFHVIVDVVYVCICTISY